MTERLPPALLRLFTPRPPLVPTKQLDRPPDNQRGFYLSSTVPYVPLLRQDPGNPTCQESQQQRKERRQRERRDKNTARIKHELSKCNTVTSLTALDDAEHDPNATSDAYKTLFIGRLDYSVEEKDLKRVFERFGPVASVKVVRNMEGKSRGYGFVEFEDERDLRVAFKEADGMRILDRRVVVDVERGRTVRGWIPKRLGGGLGKTRVGGPEVNQRYSGRDPTVLNPTADKGRR
jgi:U1 small nuclear ribonucleoprotein